LLLRRTISAGAKEPKLWLDADVVFSQVPVWSGSITKPLKLAFLKPIVSTDQNYPCVVWICGGAWLEVNRLAHLANLSSLAKAGFVIASVEYRTSNEARFPSQLEDIKSAIRFLKANAERFGINRNKIAVMGESAGGHLACLAGATGQNREFDRGENLSETSEVQAVCALYPPIDLQFPKSEANDSELFGGIRPQDFLLGGRTAGDSEITRNANPKTYLIKGSPPHLLIHGLHDQMVPPVHSEILYERLIELEVSAELIIIEDGTHGSVEFFQSKILDCVIQFFAKCLNGKESSKSNI